MHDNKEMITLSRDCPVVAVPSGKAALLQAQEHVKLHQSLGDSFTIEYQNNLYRVAGSDADALGLTVEVDVQVIVEDAKLSINDKIHALIKTIYDPEIPVNIFDLGLIYHIHVNPIQAQNPDTKTIADVRIHVIMTLTSPTCGMGPFLVTEVKRKIHLLPEVKDVQVELVFDPPWSHDHMSAEARLSLGLIY